MFVIQDAKVVLFVYDEKNYGGAKALFSQLKFQCQCWHAAGLLDYARPRQNVKVF